MSNIEEAKKILQANAGIMPSGKPTRRRTTALPKDKDVTTIENALFDKLQEALEDKGNKLAKDALRTIEPQLEDLQRLKQELKDKVEQTELLIKGMSNDLVQLNETILFHENTISDKRKRENCLQATIRERGYYSRDAIEEHAPEMCKEIKDLVLNIKIGAAPMSDAKLLMDKISLL